MSVELIDEDTTISTGDSADDESADVLADPELADACCGIGLFAARRQRVDRVFVLCLGVALFAHVAFVGAVLTWWLTSPPGIALASGRGAAESNGEMPGDGVDVAPIASPTLPEPPTDQDPAINNAGGSLAETSTAIEGLRAIGPPTMEIYSEHQTGRIGLTGETVGVPQTKRSPPAGLPGVGGPAPADGNRPPRYPPEALRKHLEGTVTLRVMIAQDGTVQDLHVDRSSGHDLLDAAAVEAVRRWRFRPAMVRGAASSCEVVLPIRFVLTA